MPNQNRIMHFLDEKYIHYEIVPHSPSKSSIGTAISAEVPMHRIAKAVILEDHEGKHIMAIVPADYKVSISMLNEELNRSFKLTKETDIYEMFTDCESGAVPPVPSAYYLDAVYDEELTREPELFLESGDHKTLIQISREDFMRLMSAYKHSRFSRKVFH